MTFLASIPPLFVLSGFAVGCRRLTPGEGYLEALQKPNVEFNTTTIEEINPRGIRLADGRDIELDVLVCATGFRA